MGGGMEKFQYHIRKDTSGIWFVCCCRAHECHLQRRRVNGRGAASKHRQILVDRARHGSPNVGYNPSAILQPFCLCLRRSGSLSGFCHSWITLAHWESPNVANQTHGLRNAMRMLGIYNAATDGCLVFSSLPSGRRSR